METGLGEKQTLFVYGSPRSGTTWIQLLLDQHPAVVTAPETQIFGFYLSGFRRQWREEQLGRENAQGGGGLSQLLDEDQFYELCRRSADYVLGRIADRNQRATVIVEKSPQHAAHARFIHRLYPDAYFLHVIRDPRDTAASLLAAGRSWGRHWAPAHPAEAAEVWRRHVEKGRQLRGTEARYRELRYEELVDDPAAALTSVLEWVGLTSEPAEVSDYVEACRLDRLRNKGGSVTLPVPGKKVPSGFFRKGRAGGWAEDLRPAEVAVIEAIARPLMLELGYEPATRGGQGARARVAVHRALARLRGSVDWQFQRLLKHV